MYRSRRPSVPRVVRSHTAWSLAALAAILAIVSAGVAGRLLLFKGESDRGDASDALMETTPAGFVPEQFSAGVVQPVRGVEVVRDTLWIRVRAAGQAEAWRRSTLKAQVDGIIQSVPARESDPAAEGDLLVQLDTIEPALNVQQARADLRVAETDYRQRLLFDDQIDDPVLRADREGIARSISGLDQAEIALRRAEVELERTQVSAPFDGWVADIQVVEGEYVATGTNLLTVVALSPIKVEVQVLETELAGLSEGNKARVGFAAFPGEPHMGVIRAINPLVDPENRTSRVTIVLPNEHQRIKPGMYADASLDAKALPDRVLVPRSAILERGEGRRTMLFIYEDGPQGGLAKWRYVNVGRENEAYAEVVAEGPEGESVQPGEIVLVEGHHYLAHDTPVRLVGDMLADRGRPGGW